MKKIVVALLIINVLMYPLNVQAQIPPSGSDAKIITRIAGSVIGFPTGLIVGGFRGGAVGVKEGTLYTAGLLGDRDSYLARAGGLLGGIPTGAVGVVLGATKSSYKGVVEGWKRPFHGESYSLDGTYLTDYKIYE